MGESTMRSQSVVFIVLILGLNALCKGSKAYSWTYKWSCAKDYCTRTHIDQLKPSQKYYETQNQCRLVCGQYGALWPKPTGLVSIQNHVAQINLNTIKFDTLNTPQSPEIQNFLTENKKIFVNNLMQQCQPNCSASSSLDLFVRFSIETDSETLSWATSESYSLDMRFTVWRIIVDIQAETIFGARHALETLTQFTAPLNDVGGPEEPNGLVMVTNANVTDAPVYPHRGFLLDTSRNFISIPAIKRTIDGMASTKLNVLHWHITDSQSFPMELLKVPQITRYGAYSTKNIYTQKEIKEVVKYGYYRGIRVMLELDAPAHAGNGWQWGPTAGLGDLAVCVNQQPWRKYCIEPPCGQLNPANPNLYRVLRDVYAEMLEMSQKSEIVHMGGDEVFFGCWNATQEIVDLLESKGHGRELDDFLQLWAEFQQTALNILDEERQKNTGLTNKIPTILWSSHLTDPSVIERFLSKDRYIIQTWVESNATLPGDLLSKGYSLIISTKNAWYFDHGFWGITRYYAWRTVYNNRILRKPGVLGGEACLWTEFIDEYSMDSRTWPRLAAVGERLWADPTTGTQEAEPRLYRHRERLINMGIQLEAITPKWCLQNEGECY